MQAGLTGNIDGNLCIGQVDLPVLEPFWRFVSLDDRSTALHHALSYRLRHALGPRLGYELVQIAICHAAPCDGSLRGIRLLHL